MGGADLAVMRALSSRSRFRSSSKLPSVGCLRCCLGEGGGGRAGVTGRVAPLCGAWFWYHDARVTCLSVAWWLGASVACSNGG